MSLAIGCVGSEWNQVRTARADAELRSVDGTLADHRRSIAAREATIASMNAQIADLDVQIVAATVQRRDRAAELSRALATVAALEQDLTAAAQRRTAIEAELATVRELATELGKRDRRLQELTGAIVARDEQLRQLEGQEVQATADAATKRAQIEARLTILNELRLMLDAAMASSAVIAPPSPAPEAAPPATDEPKK